MKPMNIVVLEGYVNNPGDLSWNALESYGTVTVYDRTSRDQLAQRVAEADIAVSSKVIWDAEALGWAPHLKMIALTSTGYNVVDLDAARERGVTVSNVPAYSTPDVAQMTFALLLELCLHVGEHSQLVMDGGWTRAKDFSFWNTPLVELAGKTMGIVGMGSIGQAVCRIARAFGMLVVFENRSPKPQFEGDGVRQVELDELLAVSDVVSLHVPATPATDRMMNERTIAQMKDGSYLLNTARGTLVDEQAVVDALRSGKLAGFAADVVSVEPMRADNPLLQAKGQNIVVTPHIAWATHEARARLLATVAANVGAFVEGHPQNVVE
ncbi:D-2-hydroxyacid dehydrogenase [Eggerthella timonensis]|uniref:D-2-hydroxyacid dehydrogenase n=1 Tax=Eggerthella timonensis TaxID=1871008 RepID=UPI001FE6084E|nr:D-2-hydroxyacid dehydrogenase [Eggerthella timonensis]